MTAARTGCLLAALVLLSWIDVQAQEPPDIGPGSRVRVTGTRFRGHVHLDYGYGRGSDATARLDGWIDTISDSTLTLATEEGSLVAIQLTSITKLEVHRGVRSRNGPAALGASIGAVAGVLAGYMIGRATAEDCTEGTSYAEELSCGLNEGAEDAAYLLGLGLLGAGVGAAIGAGFGGDIWDVVSVDRLRASITWRAGPGLRLSVNP